MPFCSNCGFSLTDTDQFCPGCGRPTEARVEKVTARNQKILQGSATTENILYGVVGAIFLVIGITIITPGVIVGLLKSISSFVSAMIGMIFLCVIGAIPFKIGMYIIDRVDNEKINNGAKTVGFVGGVILGLTQVPYYLSLVDGFY